MSKLINKQRWLSLAVVPLFSVAVMTGCSSDDDDADMETTDPDPEEMVEVVDPDGDGNGIADGFQTDMAELDTNGNAIIDAYDAGLTGGADTNENNIDDSFEVALTEGTDANNDGIDDAALAALTGETVDPEGTDPGEEMEPEAIDQTGTLALVTLLNDAGTSSDLNWNGFELTGTVEVPDGVSVNRITINSGIAGAGSGQEIIALNPGGSTYFIPTGMSESEKAAISSSINRGALFLNAELSDGSNAPGTILLPGVEPKFAGMTSANNVSGDEATTTGSGFINLNKVTGHYSAVVKINLQAADLDPVGDPETVSAVHIHLGDAESEGGPIVTLTTEDGLVWSAVSADPLSTGDLSSMLAGETYFNAHRTNSSNFIRGQIPAFNP